MAKKKESRLYTRNRGGEVRFYADLRDLGGGQVALIPPGRTRATTDPDVAAKLLADRVRALEERRRGQDLGVVERKRLPLRQVAADHLIRKAQLGRATPDWIARSEMYLQRAVEFFGAETDVTAISRKQVRDWIVELRATTTKLGAPMKAGTIRHHLHALSSLYEFLDEEEILPDVPNPVSKVKDKPRIVRTEAKWFEVHEAALFLEAARTMPPPPRSPIAPLIYPIMATLLLTGGRRNEVLGLEVGDVSFDRQTVAFRVKSHRRLKTESAARVVPLWPQLREILGAYLATRPPSRLLFPRWSGGRERSISDLRGPFLAVERWGGLPPGEFHAKALRHTFCAARLQTLDRGAPVSLDTVRREMGHADEYLVRHIYGHLGTVRHRSEAVEFRVEQHADRLGDRLRRLRARGGTVTETVTTGGA